MNIAVAVKVAATETVAVVTAVVKISGVGRGTVKSVPGTSHILISGGVGGFGMFIGTVGGLGASLVGLSCNLDGLTPGGGLRSLGGTTRGLYEGIRVLGSSNVGGGIGTGSGKVKFGIRTGSPK